MAPVEINHPQSAGYIKEYVGSYELINNKKRYCLWLKGGSPAEYRNIPEIRERLNGVAEIRRTAKTVAVQAQAETPMLFSQIRQLDTNYLAVSEVSSQNRRYIPISFLQPDVIASNKLFLIPEATLYMFGVMESMPWFSRLLVEKKAGEIKKAFSCCSSLRLV